MRLLTRLHGIVYVTHQLEELVEVIVVAGAYPASQAIIVCALDGGFNISRPLCSSLKVGSQCALHCVSS